MKRDKKHLETGFRSAFKEYLGGGKVPSYVFHFNLDVCVVCGNPLPKRNQCFCDYECHQEALITFLKTKKGLTYEQIWIQRLPAFADIFVQQPKTQEEVDEYKKKVGEYHLENEYNWSKIKKLYRKGYATQRIAREFNLSQDTIWRHLKQEGLLRDPKKYDLLFVPKKEVE